MELLSLYCCLFYQAQNAPKKVNCFILLKLSFPSTLGVKILNSACAFVILFFSVILHLIPPFPFAVCFWLHVLKRCWKYSVNCNCLLPSPTIVFVNVMHSEPVSCYCTIFFTMYLSNFFFFMSILLSKWHCTNPSKVFFVVVSVTMFVVGTSTVLFFNCLLPLVCSFGLNPIL